MNKVIDDEPIPLTEVYVGVRYHVRFSDCCVSGRFTARLTSLETSYAEGELLVQQAEFDNGVYLGDGPIYNLEFYPA